MLVFLDLETTGLKPETCYVLEVAAIITDDNLVEVARKQFLIRPNFGLHMMDEFVRDMHTKNGLLDELRCLPPASWATNTNPDPYDILEVDARLSSWIREHAVKLGKDEQGKVTLDRPQLAGNTISFDRAFLKEHLPASHAEMHYRNLDVSSLNEMARRFWPEIYAATKQSKPDGAGVEHRAMWDVQCSLHQARKYAELLVSSIPPGGTP